MRRKKNVPLTSDGELDGMGFGGNPFSSSSGGNPFSSASGGGPFSSGSGSGPFSSGSGSGPFSSGSGSGPFSSGSGSGPFSSGSGSGPFSSGSGNGPFSSGSGSGPFSSGSGSGPFSSGSGSGPFSSGSGGGNPFSSGSGVNPQPGLSPDPGLTPVTRDRWDYAALICSLVGGLVGVVLAIILNVFVLQPAIDPLTHPSIYQVLTIGSIVALAALVAAITLLIYNAVQGGRFPLNNRWPGVLAGGFVLIFGAGCLLQFLYSLGSSSAVIAEADDYIFVIDDSGSMAGTDPNRLRVSAIRELLEKLPSDKRVGMVFFTDEITFEEPLTALNDEVIERFAQDVDQLNNNGGTYIEGAVMHAMNMQGARDPDRMTEIVLLTDGQGTVSNYGRIRDECRQDNMRISAIELSPDVYRRPLEKLARVTNGRMYTVDQLDALTDVYSKVGIVRYARDLLGVRTGNDHSSVLLVVARVVAWYLLGGAIGFYFGILFSDDLEDLKSNNDWAALPFLVCMVISILFGVLMELMNMLWLDGTILGVNSKALLVPLLCATVVIYKQVVPTSGGLPPMGPGTGGGSGGGNGGSSNPFEDNLANEKKHDNSAHSLTGL